MSGGCARCRCIGSCVGGRGRAAAPAFGGFLLGGSHGGDGSSYFLLMINYIMLSETKTCMKQGIRKWSA
jgi:hypothetical protein